MAHFPPILGFVGSSGSGKTTLLESVIAILSDRGVRLAVLKHAKPGFDIDSDPGKDSYRMRSAGAAQVLVASRDRWALLAEQANPLEEPSLYTMLRHLDPNTLDAVLIEGFRHEHYPEIEVYRQAHGQPPQCWPDDRDVIAVASDVPLVTGSLPLLDLNEPETVARFAVRQWGLREIEKRLLHPAAGEPCHD